MALSSAFAILATCGDNLKKMKERGKQKKNPSLPNKKAPWMTKINSEATFQNVTAVFLPLTLLSGGQSRYMYKVSHRLSNDGWKTKSHFKQETAWEITVVKITYFNF